MRQQGEPSVEDILVSIKQVIARDSKVAGVAAPRAAEDVLDLAGAHEMEAPLLGEQSHASMRESLATLAMMAEPPAPPQIVRSGETSLEALTRELLRPALAAWLDQHLPPLVERMVADEIARIVGKKS